MTWHRAREPWLVLALGHGAGGGIGARDLRGIADALPADGVTVALVEQPWRVAGKKLAPAPKTLDTGWRGLWPALEKPGLPVVAGGRSAGARVACRTGAGLGAVGVLALSFPLHPPGRPERSRAAELLGAALPTLVVQGANDPFGAPAEFPEGEHRMVEIPGADHGFAVPKRAGITESETVKTITHAVREWLPGLRE
ncbi:alpha/beta hydrolase family protein [Streptomyces sp. NPDC055078]